MYLSPRLLIAVWLPVLPPAAVALPPYHPHAMPPGGTPPRPVLFEPRAPFTMHQPVAYRPLVPMFPVLSRQNAAPRPAERRRGGQRTLTKKPVRPAPETGPRQAPAAQTRIPKASRGDTAKESATRSAGDHRAAFLQSLTPLVERQNAALRDQRDRLVALLGVLDAGGGLDESGRTRLEAMARRYRVEGNPLDDARARRDLLEKVDVVPVSLALAQAANESDWGRSRFAREGNNLFGIWTYDESKGMVPRKRSPGRKHLVRRFDSVEESVRYYMFTLNSHPAYAEFREIRAGLRERDEPLDGHAMAKGLLRYSAKGEDYVRAIQSMIRRFDLAAFDAGGRKA